MTRAGTARSARRLVRNASTVLVAAGVALSLYAAPTSAEPVPVDPYEGCPTVIYYTVPPDSPSLFEVAETVLGDPLRASEIYEYTEGRTQPDGGTLTSDQAIRPGWYLILPYDAAGEGVLRGQDPLCVEAVDRAIAQGQEPPDPPAPPPSPEPSPSAEESAGTEAASGGSSDSRMPDIDPKILIAGVVVLVLLTIFALFWQPILRGVAWPFRKIAALPWRSPRPPRFVRTMRRNKRRRLASDVIAADRGAAKRANIGYLELVSAPAEVPARPVAVFTAPRMLTVLVPANSTPPAASWQVLKPTIWRHTRSRSATSAVRFNTTTHTNIGLAATGSTLVSMGIIERPDGGEQVFVDFGRLHGLLAIGGHRRAAHEAAQVVADGLRECGLEVLGAEPERSLRSLLPGIPEPPADPDTVPMSGPGTHRQPRRVIVLPGSLTLDDEEVLPLVPPDTLVIAPGTSSYAHWQWTVTEDGRLDTGPLGTVLTLRDSREREHQRAAKLRERRNRDGGGERGHQRGSGPVTDPRRSPRGRDRTPAASHAGRGRAWT